MRWPQILKMRQLVYSKIQQRSRKKRLVIETATYLFHNNDDAFHLPINWFSTQTIPLCLHGDQHLLQRRMVCLRPFLLQRPSCRIHRIVRQLLRSKRLLELLVLLDLNPDSVRIVVDRGVCVEDRFVFCQPRQQVLTFGLEGLRLVETSLQVSRPICCSHVDLLPAVLNTVQKVLNQDNILFLAEVLEMRSHLLEVWHHFLLLWNVLQQTLVSETESMNKFWMKLNRLWLNFY